MGRNNTKAIKSINRMYEQMNLDSDIILHKTKLLLNIYRDVVWATLHEANCIREDFAYYGNELDDALVYLESFAPDIEKEQFEERISSMFENKWMIDLVDKAMTKLYDYHNNGKLYHEILSKSYLSAFPVTPDEVPYGSNKVYWWKGKCGHEWQTSVKARSHGENCPICSNARIIPGINDLATLAPEIAKEWSEKNMPLLPSMISVGSHKKAIWCGKCGHEWSAPIRDRVRGASCPYCTHRTLLPGFNDLETIMPEIAKEWSERNYPLLPSQVAPFANKKVWWKCEHGHEWYTLISTRSGGSKCPYCTDIKVLKGFNDFATRHPRLAKEWSDRNLPLMPDEMSEKSTKNVWWKCQVCGHEWKALIVSRAKGLQCPVCADRAIKEGYNDLATTDPHILSEWDYEKNTDILPTQISRNSMRYVWWKCAFGHSRRDRISNRTIEHKRCPSCEADFDAVLPQLLVLYYANKNHLKVELDNEDTLGISLGAYIPEIKLAFDFPSKGTQLEKDIGVVTAHLCKQRDIHYVRLSNTQNRELICNEIRKGFGKAHIFITSDSDKDMRQIYDNFFEWRKKGL